MRLDDDGGLVMIAPPVVVVVVGGGGGDGAVNDCGLVRAPRLVETPMFLSFGRIK